MYMYVHIPPPIQKAQYHIKDSATMYMYMQVKEYTPRDRYQNSPHLYDRSPVISGSSDHLRGYVRVPGNAGAPHSRARVSDLDDWLVLTEIPDD